jgi:hypothetical protein
MTLGVLKINIISHIKEMTQEYPKNLSGKSKCPESANIFKVDETSTKLPKEKLRTFHTFVMQCMLLF